MDISRGFFLALLALLAVHLIQSDFAILLAEPYYVLPDDRRDALSQSRDLHIVENIFVFHQFHVSFDCDTCIMMQ